MEEKITTAQAKELYKDIVSIKFEGAEGKIDQARAIDQSRPLRTPEEAERFINSNLDKPDIGYNKVNTIITFSDGSKLENFRYDHGKKDPDFIDQLMWYLENRISMDEEKEMRKEKIIKVTEDVRLPGTDILLEKGDRIKVVESDSYYASEFSNLVPTDEFGIQVQFSNSSGKTKYMNMNPDLLAYLTQWLKLNHSQYFYR